MYELSFNSLTSLSSLKGLVGSGNAKEEEEQSSKV